MKLIYQILLSPFALIYGVIVFVRNKLYDIGILKSFTFKHPILIGIGNLSTGGTGKTPHVEYVVNQLSKNYVCGTLSRGYKRKTTGFLLANEKHSATDIGDEPLQYYNKYDHVAVAEKRAEGIRRFVSKRPTLEVIVLDDVFQHRAIQPHLNILITDYSKLFIDDFLLPAGRLREWRCGKKRADYIIVSKCPKEISTEEMNHIEKRLDPTTQQKVFFSSIEYASLQPFTAKAEELLTQVNSKSKALLITGIANPTPLLTKLEDDFETVHHLKYNDHHSFSQNDLVDIRNAFKDLPGDNKIIISTEKDIMRLSLPVLKKEIDNLPLYFIPIEVEVKERDNGLLNQELLNYVRENKRNNSLSQ